MAQIVSDNGPQFVAEELKTFLREKGIQQIPYHPKTNDLAERFVKAFKSAMKATKNDSGTIQTKLSKFLIAYRNTPHSTTNESPATLFLGRTLTTRLDLVKPNLSETVSKTQQKMVRSTRDRQYKLGDTVSVRDYRSEHNNWIPGVIHRKTGPVSYQVEVSPTHTGEGIPIRFRVLIGLTGLDRARPVTIFQLVAVSHHLQNRHHYL